MSPLDEAIIANDALPERERKTNIDLAEEFNHRQRVVASLKKLLPDRIEANNSATDIQVVKHEALNVVFHHLNSVL